MELNELLTIAINASIEAGKEILKIYNSDDFDVNNKSDNSPLTKADTESNTVIDGFLTKTSYPIISEENKLLAFEQRKDWPTYWVVDPLDGTKEFIKKNGEFTVNIALCQDTAPILGVIYVPVSRELYYADVTSKKAFKTILDDNHQMTASLFQDKDTIKPNADEKKLRVVGSRSHMNDDTLKFIENAKNSGKEIEVVSKGSSLKFCLVAEGKADVYPRFAPTMEWDTAAGQAICNAVGLKVISKQTNKELTYNKENLLNPYFLVTQ
jgi:3'(2'), 5'-bisphosphate nucleotidase